MAVKQINGILKKLDWKKVEATLLSAESDDADPEFEVCEASLEDWERYVKSETQVLVSRSMAFEDGRIYIVELPTEIHDNFCRDLDFAILIATGTGNQHLRPRGSSYVESHQKLEPDCSFGPPPGIGAVRPVGMDWGEYHTLKVEVGVSREWPYLDRKADRWRQFSGVEYIFCIRISPALRVHQYKLHTVVNRANPLPVINPIPIANPTNVAFNSRRLLGLVGRGHTPQGFSRPNVVIDLFPLVERLIQENQ
ncbi:uncharacterized protein PHALS_08321 [Plasmopara halstedii]|uniref:Restriction endonuclease domain-containing protein n=1 Tax=Plasmopara halstedii TaxID=4781 RepID=A0A0P1AD16_PLAHL|nr:uncharacterized protein PHALS_08321 [Plasmopara halstedii]CEG38234.1 hypothetical protein PHALS_08321 [Plasmopara halstedii]|eukprot:XP_024574603.1 hypothetical protein PHALS_08321 [Plasmopara halstedii]